MIKTEEKPLSYIYSGELPNCGKKEAKIFLENINSRLKKKLEAEKIHGTAEKAEYLENVMRKRKGCASLYAECKERNS